MPTIRSLMKMLEQFDPDTEIHATHGPMEQDDNVLLPAELYRGKVRIQIVSAGWAKKQIGGRFRAEGN